MKLKAALERPELSDALFSVAFHTEEAKPFLKEWKTESEPTVYVRDEYEPFEQLEGYSFAFLTKEQAETLLENSAENAPFLYYSPLVEGYPENVGMDLVTVFEYRKPKKEYEIMEFLGSEQLDSGTFMTKEEIIVRAEEDKRVKLILSVADTYDPLLWECFVTEIEDGKLTNQTKKIKDL